MKILLWMRLWTKKSPLDFDSHLDLEFGLRIWTGFILREVCTF